MPQLQGQGSQGPGYLGYWSLRYEDGPMPCDSVGQQGPRPKVLDDMPYFPFFHMPVRPKKLIRAEPTGIQAIPAMDRGEVKPMAPLLLGAHIGSFSGSMGSFL